MNPLIEISQNLPANIEELAKFILISQERLVSIRAEIRALTKTGLLKEIMEQKKEEARMVSDTLLDAQMRFGEVTRGLPKASGGDRKSEKIKFSQNEKFDFHESKKKPKLEVIKSLGFTPKQTHEFEILANNPDIVEQVKAEARDNDDLPTRSRVLQLVRDKRKAEKPIQVDQQEIKKIVNAIFNASSVPTNLDLLKGWVNNMQDDEEFNFNIMMIEDAIEKFQVIKAFITRNRRK